MTTTSASICVPDFQVGRRRGPAPTLVVAYGAFGVSLTPGYDPVVGKGWLERGGTLIVANTRGGGEYGPIGAGGPCAVSESVRSRAWGPRPRR